MYLRTFIGKKYRYIRNYLYQPNRKAILLLGLNKSGTSVTINLISKKADISFFDDFPYRLGGFEKVLSGNTTLESYVKKHSYYFSKEIIRYPIQPEAIDLARKCFEMNKYLLTIRHPANNIKSILSRLNIRGDLKNLDTSKLNIHSNWLRMLTKKENYIDSLIACWNEAYSQEELIRTQNCIIFKYEDFLKNKELYITNKVKELGLEPKFSIEEYLNTQYQPSGTNKSNLVFFGANNYEKIKNNTNIIANKFGYQFE